jgi:hypothetical protein
LNDVKQLREKTRVTSDKTSGTASTLLLKADGEGKIEKNEGIFAWLVNVRLNRHPSERSQMCKQIPLIGPGKPKAAGVPDDADDVVEDDSEDESSDDDDDDDDEEVSPLTSCPSTKSFDIFQSGISGRLSRCTTPPPKKNCSLIVGADAGTSKDQKRA